jgi:hypothetical protein
MITAPTILMGSGDIMKSILIISLFIISALAQAGDSTVLEIARGEKITLKVLDCGADEYSAPLVARDTVVGVCNPKVCHVGNHLMVLRSITADIHVTTGRDTKEFVKKYSGSVRGLKAELEALKEQGVCASTRMPF